jgi:hypothetical protein
MNARKNSTTKESTQLIKLCTLIEIGLKSVSLTFESMSGFSDVAIPVAPGCQGKPIILTTNTQKHNATKKSTQLL